MPTLYERAKAAGLAMGSHESDLYLKDTPDARRILQEWREESGRDVFVTYFRDNIEHEQWMDIAFAFDPFWEGVSRGSV